jgi:hypothetical protein
MELKKWNGMIKEDIKNSQPIPSHSQAVKLGPVMSAIASSESCLTQSWWKIFLLLDKRRATSKLT